MTIPDGQHKGRRWSRYLVGFVLVSGLIYGFFMYTSPGRIAGVYVVGGFKAPWGVRTECRHEAQERVTDLFQKPLKMTDDAKGGLREYWHYSLYRECLYRAGYSFLGNMLPESTLYIMGEDDLWYVNTLAGVYLRVPTETSIVRDNELDVTFDARLLRSELSLPDGPVYLDTYTSHQFVHTFADLPGYLDHFTAGTSTVTKSSHATTSLGVPYIDVQQNNGTCGIMTVSPDAYIVHLFAPCAEHDKVRTLVETLKLIPAISTH